MKHLAPAPFALLLVVLAAFTNLRPTSARAAQRELLTQAGEAGTLALDQLSGFRTSSAGGFGYAAPLGFGFQSLHAEGVAGGPAVTQRVTTFYVAPSLDVFVLDRFSVGGLVEFAWQNQSLELTPPGGASTKTGLAATTSFTVLPRIGYLIPLGDRVAIWPRLGVGYGSLQTPIDAVGKVTTGSLLVDVDVGLLYRIDETFFLRIAPELTLSPTGSRKGPAAGGGTLSAGTTSVAFSSTVGFGIFWAP